MKTVLIRIGLILAVLSIAVACEKDMSDITPKELQNPAIESRITDNCDPCLSGDVILGPLDFLRRKGKPKWVSQVFTVENSGEVCFEIHTETATAAWVSVNGTKIFTPGDFTGEPIVLTHTIDMSAGDHELHIKVAGAPGTIVTSTVRACSPLPCVKCSEVAKAAAESIGLTVVQTNLEEGNLVATDGRPAQNNCDMCGVYQIFVWKDGSRDQTCLDDGMPYISSMQAGHKYSGHTTCTCTDDHGFCGYWDMQGCIPD
jgi:hypothetical protein